MKLCVPLLSLESGRTLMDYGTARIYAFDPSRQACIGQTLPRGHRMILVKRDLRHVRMSSVDPVTRQSLILRVKNPTDKDAWTEFWVLYEPLLRRYCRRLELKENEEGDLINDLYLKLRELLPRFDLDHSRGQFRGWLRRVTDNTVRDFYRRRKRAARQFADEEQIPDRWGEDGDSETIREKEWQHQIDLLVIERVKEEFAHRRTTWLCFEKSTLGGIPAKEVASELGIKKHNTVYVYAKRVVDRIRELRREYDQEYDPEVHDARHDVP